MDWLLHFWHDLVAIGAILLNVALYGLIGVGIVLIFTTIAVYANMQQKVYDVIMHTLLFVLASVFIILSLMTIFWNVHIIPIPYSPAMIFLV